MEHNDYFELAESCCAAYRKNLDAVVDKKLLKRNLEAFRAVIFHADRAVRAEKIGFFGRVFDGFRYAFLAKPPIYVGMKNHGYYMGNLVKTHALEGRERDVVGLLPEAIDRTVSWIDGADTIRGSQAERISRCLKVALEKETFAQSCYGVVDILRPYESDLRAIVTTAHK